MNVVCEKCGRKEPAPALHTLPDGWEQIYGDDFCPACMKPFYDWVARKKKEEEEANG